jgi:predicted metal-binding membrane protein
MLTMFAVGVGSLAWMVGLTGVMVIEKTSRHGRRLAPLVGVALLIWGALILLQPGWLPTPLSGRS